VEFESRCKQNIGVKPERIDLDINYRSRKQIVSNYTKFINLIDWKKPKKEKGQYRIYDKNILAYSKDNLPSVITSSHSKKNEVYKEIANFVYNLKKKGKIEDYSQCAFLFPAMKNNTRVKGYMEAFENS
jgi:DNA helicase-2/ATP-dependent DNA helicase PcrA